MAESETECAAPGLNTVEPECVTAHNGVSDVHHTHTLIETETDLGFPQTENLIQTEGIDHTELGCVTRLPPDQIKTEADDEGYIKAEPTSGLQDMTCVPIKSEQMMRGSTEKLVSDTMNVKMSVAGDHRFDTESNTEQIECSHSASTAEMEDTISKLKRFSQMDFHSKQELINIGRPTPALKDLLQIEKSKLSRSFQTEWYTRKDWLCGCAVTNRLYCFPCLLFSKCESLWTTSGFSDLKNLPRSLSKHERSVPHIQSQIALKTFGTVRVGLAVKEQRRLNKSVLNAKARGVHNAKVKENREILKDLINATCFLARQGLEFRGQDGSSSSSNRGNFAELLHAFAEKDEKLARHLATSTVFSRSSNRMQDNLIEAVAEVIRNDIKKEVNAASFVAVEVDETTDVTDKARISIVLRYVAESELDGEVREAFLGCDVCEDRQAPAIAEYILGVLEKYDCVEKLVAQAYDGASVMSSELDGVQAKMKEKVPLAMFTHCDAHALNRVTLHSAKCMPESRTFFKTVEGLWTFFSESTQRTFLLDELVKGRLPRAAPIKWSSNSNPVQTISTYQFDMRAVFRIMSDNPDIWDNDTLMMADGYERWLSKASTCFLIMAYENIFIGTDALIKVLQNKATDSELCCARIRDTLALVERKREEFNSFYERFEQKCATLGLTDGGQQSVRDERKGMYYDILDNITAQLKAWLDHFGALAFLGLVDCTKFKKMSQHFDYIKLHSLSKYDRLFDLNRLKADLIGLYSSQILQDECQTPGELHSFLAQKDLMQAVPEATKFLQLVLTILASTVSVGRPFSAFKRLKTYSQNWTDRGRLASQAFISIERERLLKLEEDKEDFYNKVTEIFVQKDGRKEFIYQ